MTKGVGYELSFVYIFTCSSYKYIFDVEYPLLGNQVAQQILEANHVY